MIAAHRGVVDERAVGRDGAIDDRLDEAMIVERRTDDATATATAAAAAITTITIAGFVGGVGLNEQAGARSSELLVPATAATAAAVSRAGDGRRAGQGFWSLPRQSWAS
jgi:hypothetical protein